MKKVALGLMIMLAMGGLSQAFAQEEPEEEIRYEGGKKGVVTFTHGEHGDLFKCVACHHYSVEIDGELVEEPGCVICHVKEGKLKTEDEFVDDGDPGVKLLPYVEFDEETGKLKKKPKEDILHAKKGSKSCVSCHKNTPDEAWLDDIEIPNELDAPTKCKKCHIKEGDEEKDD